jgi:hypothetical protein
MMSFAVSDNNFSILFIIFGILFVIVVGLILVIVARSVMEWGKNNNSPKVSAKAKIVAKRYNIHGGHEAKVYTSSYYVTFEFATGDRKEFAVPPQEYGLLAEGDVGTLTFQGTRYISFERNI